DRRRGPEEGGPRGVTGGPQEDRRQAGTEGDPGGDPADHRAEEEKLDPPYSAAFGKPGWNSTTGPVVQTPVWDGGVASLSSRPVGSPKRPGPWDAAGGHPSGAAPRPTAGTNKRAFIGDPPGASRGRGV